MKREPRCRNWTQDETDFLFYLRDVEGKDWPAIALIMKIDQKRCMSKYSNEHRMSRPTLVHRLDPEILADRDRRLQARESMSMTGLFFGDPPPGFSALDQQRARA